MSFLKNVGALSKPRITTIQHDFGGDLGVQDVNIRELSFRQRAELFIKRTSKDGAIDMASADGGLFLNAEIVAATVCDEKGKLALTVDAVKEWPPSTVDELCKKIMEVTKLTADPADPSPATS